jgi:hypothetical protein
MKTIACALLILAAPLAAEAQEPSVSPRGFFLATYEQFAAKQAFDAVFGSSSQPFFGGGGGVTLRNGLAFSVDLSHFHKTGQRAIVYGGQAFQTGIPLDVSVTAIEGEAGYRFRIRRLQSVVPFINGGIGQYHYKESSPDDTSGEGVDASHVGYLVNGGVEFRVQKWVGISIDAQWTHVTGILGTGGVSKQTGEDDLGGVAARLKVIVGR